MRTRRPRVRRTVALVAWGAAAAALWIASTEPWGLGVFELAAFLAPGAMMGLAASWIGAAFSPGRWHWRDGLKGAALGAAFLPPVFAFMVALAGATRPAHTLEALVLFAWLALGAGALVALSGLALRLVRRGGRGSTRRRRRKTRTPAAPPATIAPDARTRWFSAR